jgi:hypothetical protein
LGIYIKIAALITHLQDYTKTATYKGAMVFGSACVCSSYGNLHVSIERNKQHGAALQQILEFQVHKAFINDYQLFWGSSRKHLDDHYGLLLSFLDKSLEHVTFHHPEADVFLFHCSLLSVATTALPLLLNTAWWTNSISITTAILSTWASFSTLPYRYLLIAVTPCSTSVCRSE